MLVYLKMWLQRQDIILAQFVCLYFTATGNRPQSQDLCIFGHSIRKKIASEEMQNKEPDYQDTAEKHSSLI